MYQAKGINTSKVYAQGTKADCLRLLNKNYPYIVSDKSQSGWGRGNIVTGKPIFDEPLRIIKADKVLMGRKNS